MKEIKYLIIGGGIAGTTAAETVRHNDAFGSIAIISEEPYPVYSRVMLSKHDFYSKEWEEDKIWFRKPDWYQKENIELIAGKSAVSLNAGKKIVRLNDGNEIEYEKLLIATGSCARKWTVPGSDKKNIFYLRNLNDAKAIREKIKTAKKAVAIGGGFVSFEMCHILRQFNIDTTLILRESYYWEPILDKNEAVAVEEALIKGGVKIFKNSEVGKVTGVEFVEGVVLKDGTKIDCDMVIAGIGVTCALDWLKSNIQTNKGILTNEYLETNLADVWASGDVAEFNDLILEERVQLGNWLNAQQQGRIAGLNMAGKREPFRLVTSYSTGGFGISICFVGDVRPDADRVMISRGTLESRSGARIVLKDGEIIGATLINRMPELSLISKLIETDFKISGHETELADSNFDLKKLIKIKIGWFTFSCCEDNTIVMTEVMNDHWQEWKKIFDFRHVRVLKSNNILDELDIAFIEGAIASQDHINKLKEIREKSKKLVAIGACAIVGMPAGQRNYFSEEQKKEIEFLTARFAALPKVLRVSDVVKVDAEVPGCPMDPNKFLEVVNNLVKEFQQ